MFPLSFAQLIGLDPLQMKMQMTGGVGSTGNATYYDDVRVEIPVETGETISFETFAGFTTGLDAQGIGLLGQKGFFEFFLVAFNHRLKSFSVFVEGGHPTKG